MELISRALGTARQHTFSFALKNRNDLCERVQGTDRSNFAMMQSMAQQKSNN